ARTSYRLTFHPARPRRRHWQGERAPSARANAQTVHRWGGAVSLRKKRLLLLSSSAIMLLYFAGLAASQGPSETPTSAGTMPPGTAAPSGTPPAGPPEETKPTDPPASSSQPSQPGEGTVLPPVTVTPPSEKPKRKPPVEPAPTRERPTTSEPPPRQVERPAARPRVPADQGAQIATETATLNRKS